MTTAHEAAQPAADDGAAPAAPTPPPAHAPPRRLRTDVFMMAATKGLALVLGIVTSAILARGLGASGRGTLAVAFNMTLLLVQFGLFGLSTANPYYVAQQPAQLPRVIWNSIWAAFSIGTFFVGAGFVVMAVAPGVLEGVTWLEAGIAFAAIPFTLGQLYLQSILLGQGRTVAYNVVEALAGLGAAFGLVIGFALFDMGVGGALGVLLVQQMVSFVAFALLLAKHAGKLRLPDMSLARMMMRYGFRAYVAVLASYLVIRIDMLFVNAWLGADAAGQYAVAVALADGMALLPMAVAFNLFPRVARGAATEMTAEIFRSFGLLFALFCLATVPFAGIGIRVLYGEQFADAATLYLVMLPGIYFLGMLTVLAQHFAGRGFPLEAMLVWLIGLAINVGINVAFLNRWGTEVAAAASSITYLVLYLLHARMFVSETGSVRALVPRPREALRIVRGALSRG